MKVCLVSRNYSVSVGPNRTSAAFICIGTAMVAANENIVITRVTEVPDFWEVWKSRYTTLPILHKLILA